MRRHQAQRSALAVLHACSEGPRRGDDSDTHDGGNATTDGGTATDAGEIADAGHRSDGGAGCETGRTLCGDVCADLANDAMNCSGCGNLCITARAFSVASCRASQCVITTEEHKLGQFQSLLAAGATGLHFFDLDTTPAGSSQRYKLQRIRYAGGEPTTLASQTGDGWGGIVVDASGVYWNSGIRTYRLGTDDAAPVQLNPPGTRWSRLAVDAHHVFGFVENGSTFDLVRMPKSGGASTLVHAGAAPPLSLTADADTLYWSDANRGIHRVGKDGSGSAMLAAAGATPLSVAVDDTHVYWTEAVSDGAIMKVAKSGGAPEQLAPGRSNPTALRVHDGWVWWVGYSGLHRVRVSGGPDEKLGDGFANALVVDGQDIWWLVGDYYTHSATLYRTMVMPR